MQKETKEVDRSKEIFLEAAYQYSLYGIIRKDTMTAIIGEKPKDRELLRLYWRRQRSLLQKVSLIAARL